MCKADSVLHPITDRSILAQRRRGGYQKPQASESHSGDK